jgi:tRNA A-37 threonylcarbamoyl transferase component Bud32
MLNFGEGGGKDRLADSGQDNEDALLGQKAVELGLISPKQLNETLREQARLRHSGADMPSLGYLLVSRGLIPEQQLVSLLWEGELKRSDADIQDFLQSFDAPPEDPKAVATRRLPILKEGDLEGTAFGKFRLLREVGRGGMAVVYEAEDSTVKRRVALKMLLPSSRIDPDEAKVDEERFLAEARLSANLPRHPGLVGIHETGVIDGKRYISMEFIDGREMALWWRRSYASLRLQVRVLRDVALIVHHAHQNGLIHRDLKPANILVDQENKPHVTDFGLARGVRRDEDQKITRENRVVGTPHYMSPEQAEGRRSVDRRSDVWALGVLLYEMLTGRPPFRGATAMEIMVKVARDPLVPPSQLNVRGVRGKIDRALEDVCVRALQKVPKDRHATAKQFADELTSWLRSRGGGDALGGHRLFALAGIGAGTAALLLVILFAAGVFTSAPPRANPPMAAAPASPVPPAAVPSSAPRSSPPPPADGPARLEGEALRPRPPLTGSVRAQSTASFPGGASAWSKGAQLFWTGGTPKRRLRLELPSRWEGPCTLTLGLTRAQDYGIFRIFVNDVEVMRDLDLYSPRIQPNPPVRLEATLNAGMNELAFEVQGSNKDASPTSADSDLFQLGLDYVVIQPR